MKKKSLKLELRKIKVSNLSSIHGGAPKEVYTLTKLGDACCPVIDDPNTQLTTCYSGAPHCPGDSDDCHYSYRSHCPFTTRDVCD